MGETLDLGGEVVYETPRHHLPLPPPLPGRRWPTINGNSQYVLPHPVTGKVTNWTRVSTVAKAIDGEYLLEKWRRRQMLIGLSRSIGHAAELDQVMAEYSEGPVDDEATQRLRRQLDGLAEDCERIAGGDYWSEFGTCVHAWCAAVDNGQVAVCDVPALVRDWVRAYLRILAEYGLTPEPGWTERTVINLEHGIVGTLDNLYRDVHGVLRLGDIKTSRTMNYSWVYFGAQTYAYWSADFVLSVDGTTWEPMPALEPDVALVAHLPREGAEAAEIVPLDLAFGQAALSAAMAARAVRSGAAKRARSVLYEVGSIDVAVRRRHAARYLVQTAQTRADLEQVWEDYRDVWDDSLTALGFGVLNLITPERRNLS